jgi:peptidoglycan/xylan/chitin deacetylase (PgdA/CDA1 family)
MGEDGTRASDDSNRLERALRGQTHLWDLYTRKEEYEPSLRDRYDRFPRFLSQESDILEPRVSAFLREQGARPEYPEGRNFAVCLTHDIDMVFETYEAKLTKAIQAFATKDLKRMLRHIRHITNLRIPNWTFDNIMRLEERYQVRSTFFFLAHHASDPSANYLLDDLVSVLGELHDGGWEVGLHGGFDAYLDMEKLRQEKGVLEKALGHSVGGYRGHFLKFRVPDTWEALSQAGFVYDTTIGYPDCAGFRNGMCHPYRPYNLRTGSWIDIMEVPLVIMDTSIFEHMRLNAEQAWELTSRLLGRVNEMAGAVSILWHNSSFSGEMLEFYERILRYCEENRAWMTTCEKLVKHWRGERLFP